MKVVMILIFQVVFFCSELVFNSGSMLFASDKINVADNDKTNVSEVSVLLTSYLATNPQPQPLLETALSIRNDKPFGDTLSVAASNFLLQKTAAMVEDFRYNSNPIKSIKYRRMAKQLQQLGIPVDIPVTTFQKVLINLKQKNYDYLFNRLQLHVKHWVDVLLSTFLVLFVLSLLLVSILIFFLVKKRKYFGVGVIGSVILALVLLYIFAPALSKLPQKAKQVATFDFQVGKGIGADLILDERQFPVGKIIWAGENDINFNYYFSPNNIGTIIDSITEQKQLLLASTASFVNNQVEPVGLSAVDGQLLNPMIHGLWDGVVLISEKSLQVVPLFRNQKSNVHSNFESYYQLISCIDSSTDAFQVPLLVFNDSLMFDPEKASTNYRENRFLIKVLSSENECKYLIVDVEKEKQLASNTLAIYHKLKRENFKIQFMVLFDVGANNLFQVYNSNGIRNNNYRSTLPAEMASNILAVQLVHESEYSVDLLY